MSLRPPPAAGVVLALLLGTGLATGAARAQTGPPGPTAPSVAPATPAPGPPAPGSRVAARPLEFPAPDLPVTVTPVPLGLARPPLEPPAPAPLPGPPAELGSAPPPRFATAAQKPLPPGREPGALTCAFVALGGRAVTTRDCGIAKVVQGDLVQGRAWIEESVAIDPRGDHAPEAYLWLGEVAVREGRVDQAERHYRAALGGGLPAELAPHAALGAALTALRRGDPAEARRVLSPALAPSTPQPLALLARFLDGVTRLYTGRPAEALAAWETVASSGATPPLRDELLFWRGVALARQGDLDDGVRELDRFVALVPAGHPLRIEAMVQAAWLALERQAPGDAVRRFLLADQAGLRPDLRAAARAGLVRAYVALGDPGRALDQARRLAIEAPRDPLVPAALLVVAEDATRRRADTEAVDVYRQLRGLALPPGLADYAGYRLGEALERAGRTGEARSAYQELRDRGRDEAIAQRAAYRLGLVGLAERDPGPARREGEALLRAGVLPELREGTILLAAEGAARGGDPNRAATLFRLALREFPDSPRQGATRLALGWALAQDREPENALREWQELVRTADLETAAQAYLAIAEVALGRGHDEQALDALRQLRALAPNHPLAGAIALDFGILSVRSQAWAEAAAVLEPLPPRLGDFARQALVRRALGLARYRLGQHDAAERQFRIAAQLAPGEASSWLGAGLAALAQSRLAEADEALLRARQGATPEVAAAAGYGLVLVAFRRGDAEGFRDRATTFADRYPTHPAAPVLGYALVVTSLEQGQLEAAEGWVRRLGRDHPRSEYVPDALLRLAVAATEKRPGVARQAYRDLLARQPGPALRGDAWLGIAETALALGDPADAARSAESFLREAGADPRAPRAQELAIRAYQAQGRRDLALRGVETFLARFPTDPGASAMQLTRGQLLFEERRWDAAQAAFASARDQGEPPVAAPAQFWLGEALRARDDHEAAVAAYLGAAYLYPGTPWAAQGWKGAAQSYLARNMRREAAIVLRKLGAAPGADPALVQWARQALAQLGPLAGEEAAGPALRKGPAPRP